MDVVSISWIGNCVQVISGYRTYTCPMEERDDDFYFKFKKQWHPVSKYADDRLDAEIKTHKHGIYKQRDYISQAEFERICKQVLSEYSNIIDYSFEEPGILHVSYPSHSGRSRNGATINFGANGYITHKNPICRSDNNKGIFIAEDISRRILSALYD